MNLSLKDSIRYYLTLDRTQSLKKGIMMTTKKIIVKLHEQAGKPDRNGFIYPREVLEKALTKFQEKIELGHAYVNYLPYQGPTLNPIAKINSLVLDEEGFMTVEFNLLEGASLPDNLKLGIQMTRPYKSPPVIVTETEIYSINVILDSPKNDD